ncbi:MAG: hypothetical protein ABS75_28050 [Pelagibacterium sp. SCN 63-23]|nr:MAG: hypothetical protein ABS75_28050 [Pelagibacterium sp. SCN 63-23]
MIKNAALADRLRQTAYFLWEQDGKPEGKSTEYWLRAKDMLQRELAYDRWIAEGAPPDQSDLYWTEAARELDPE